MIRSATSTRMETEFFLAQEVSSARRFSNVIPLRACIRLRSSSKLSKMEREMLPSFGLILTADRFTSDKSQFEIKSGKYLGTLEVSQDITDIKKIEDEKRLLDWK